jgi:hypothetical protein
MSSTLGLVLLILLGARDAAVAPAPGSKKTHATAAVPIWAQGMPPANASECSTELRKRIADGRTARVRAVVKAYYPVALESFDLTNGGFHVSGTSVTIVAPREFAGLALFVHHDQEPTDGSCWRTPGCAAEFDVYERLLEARRAGINCTWLLLYDTELKNTVLDRPTARKRTGRSVLRDTDHGGHAAEQAVGRTCS